MLRSSTHNAELIAVFESSLRRSKSMISVESRMLRASVPLNGASEHSCATVITCSSTPKPRCVQKPRHIGAMRRSRKWRKRICLCKPRRLRHGTPRAALCRPRRIQMSSFQQQGPTRQRHHRSKQQTHADTRRQPRQHHAHHLDTEQCRYTVVARLLVRLRFQPLVSLLVAWRRRSEEVGNSRRFVPSDPGNVSV